MIRFFEFIGQVTLFGLRAVARMFTPPFELRRIWSQLGEIGSRSCLLVTASGFAMGAIMTLHTRMMLVAFGAEAVIPRVQSFAFSVEIGPLVAGLLVAGAVVPVLGRCLPT